MSNSTEMPYRLTAISPLDGFHQQYTDCVLEEVTDQALISIAVPSDRRDALQQALVEGHDVEIPVVGKSTYSEPNRVRLLGMQQDQLFMLLPNAGATTDHNTENPTNKDTIGYEEAIDRIAGTLGNRGYYTDQSDSWVMLRIAGDASRTALERICMLDLHPDVFAIGDVARTSMEHLAVIILRESDDAYLMLSPRSSAGSFLHAIETSVRYVI